MRKVAAVCLLAGAAGLASTPVAAHVDVAIGIGAPWPAVVVAPPPVYYEPAPVIVEPPPVVVAPGYYYDEWQARAWRRHIWREQRWREREWRERQREWRRWYEDEY